MLKSRPPAVAGLFYPSDADVLAQTVKLFLDQSMPVKVPDVKALVVPHAGYIYSGPIAATAYQALSCRQQTIRRVILLGPAHRVGFKGIADCESSSFLSPLGDIRVDRVAMDDLKSAHLIRPFAVAHEEEHSLEVQLPFLQQSIDKEFELIPLLVGDETIEHITNLLHQLWLPTDLIIVSTDLSHYLPYEQAQKKDSATANLICQLDSHLAGHQACGHTPLNGLMRFAAQQSWQVECLDQRNSGDTAGDKQRVVGYGAFVLY